MKKSDWPFSYQGRPISSFTERCAHLAYWFVLSHGTTLLWPDMILEDFIRPAAKRAGITGKQIGWHTFRHSLGTNLRALSVDVKTARELLRYANAKLTLDLYPRPFLRRSGKPAL
jgi:site-specific recombinase XerD